MSRLIDECSIKDTSILRKLILENPELPVLVFVGEEAYQGEYSYNQADASKGEVEYLTLYKEEWIGEDEYKDILYNDLADEEEYKDLSDEEYEKMINKRVEDTEFVEAIVIFIG